MAANDDTEAVYQSWRLKRVKLCAERLNDAVERAEALRWQVVKLAQSLLEDKRVSLPNEVRTDLEMILRAESGARRDAA